MRETQERAGSPLTVGRLNRISGGMDRLRKRGVAHCYGGGRWKVVPVEEKWGVTN